MFLTHSKTDYQNRLRTLASRASDLYERAERGEEMTARDLALAIQYNQEYIDILEELEHADLEMAS